MGLSQGIHLLKVSIPVLISHWRSCWGALRCLHGAPWWRQLRRGSWPRFAGGTQHRAQCMADMAIFADIFSILPCIEQGVYVGVGSGSWHRPRSKSRYFQKACISAYDAVRGLYRLALLVWVQENRGGRAQWARRPKLMIFTKKYFLLRKYNSFNFRSKNPAYG